MIDSMPRWARVMLGVAVAVTLIGGGVAIAQTLIEVNTERVLCPEHDGGVGGAGGVSASPAQDASGFKSISCSNPSTNPIYITGASITTTHAVPICTDPASCGGSTISLDTYRSQINCVIGSGTATADGGTPMYCIYGR